MRTSCTLPSKEGPPATPCYANLPRALPILEVALDATGLQHFEDKRWSFQFDNSEDILHCHTLSEAEWKVCHSAVNQDSSGCPTVRSPDGEIDFRLNKDFELEIVDLVDGRVWKTKLPELRVDSHAQIRLTMSRTGEQIFFHVSDSRYLDRKQSQPILFVFSTNRTPRRNVSAIKYRNKKPQKEKKSLGKLVDKLLDKFI